MTQDVQHRAPAAAMAYASTDRSPGMVEVRVNEPMQLGEAIKDAVSTIAAAAEHHQTGIMVTRIGPDYYIVRAHPAIPYGFVRQQHR